MECKTYTFKYNLFFIDIAIAVFCPDMHKTSRIAP